MRDNTWLNQRLDHIWQLLFADVKKLNEVKINFKGKWKNKFGHIMMKDGASHIVINGFFRDLRVPEFIIDLTIAHELIHYMHGFNSPHPKQFKYPHKGGIVEKELKRRGFSHVMQQEKKWIENQWQQIVSEEFKPRKKTSFW